MRSLKKQFLLLFLVCFVLSDLYGQKKEKDYEILNKLFPQLVEDSAYFECEFVLKNKRFASSICGHLHRLADSVALSSEFEHYTPKSVAKKISKAEWDKNKVNYPIRTTEEQYRHAFSVSPILYSKNKQYFFVVVDYRVTHIGCRIFKIMDDGSIKLLTDTTILIRTPWFR